MPGLNWSVKILNYFIQPRLIGRTTTGDPSYKSTAVKSPTNRSYNKTLS